MLKPFFVVTKKEHSPAAVLAGQHGDALCCGQYTVAAAGIPVANMGIIALIS